MTQFNPIIVKTYTDELARVNGVFNTNVESESVAYPSHKLHPNVESYRAAYELGRNTVLRTQLVLNGIQHQVDNATIELEQEIRKLEIKMKLAEDESDRVENIYTDLLNGDSAAYAQLKQQTDNNKIIMYQSVGLLFGCGICIYGAMRK